MTVEQAIRLTDVSKRFIKYEDSPALATSLRHLLTRSKRSALWAVRDVNLGVGVGECVGLIGRNGSGKSTLLQMLCGVTAPSTGEVRVRGRIAPLISVGVGFHPELTGRENILVNGTILGMSRREVDARLDAIVDFSGVEKFLDTPIKFYSSGMTVRLGFSVAVHATPEVLLVDEVLAVGDLSFQVRSFDRMLALREAGTTIVVVSHSLQAIERLCPRTLVLDGGRTVFDGQTRDAISVYHDVLSAADRAEQEGDPRVVKRETGVVTVTDVHLVDESGHPTAHVDAGSYLAVKVSVRADQAVDAPFAGVTVRSASGVVIYTESNVFAPFPALAAGQEASWLVQLGSGLTTGSYAISVSVGNAGKGRELTAQDTIDDFAILAAAPPVTFYVAGRAMVHGVADLQARFSTLAGRPQTPDQPAPSRTARA